MRCLYIPTPANARLHKLFSLLFLIMDVKQQPESVEEKTPEQKTGDDAKTAPDQAPSSPQPGSSTTEESKPKPEPKPHRKVGPSVIIAPGPGSDVVATPPTRI